MPYEPLDLGRILQTATVIKSARNQDALQQLQQQYLGTQIQNAQQDQQLQMDEAVAKRNFFTADAILKSKDPRATAEALLPDGFVQKWNETHQVPWDQFASDPNQIMQLAQTMRTKAGAVAGIQDKIDYKEAGGKLVPIDARSGAQLPDVAPIEKTVTPGEQLSSDTTKRGQDMTSATTRRGQDLTNAREIDKIKQQGSQQYQTNAGKLRDDYAQLVSKTGWHDLQGFYQRMQQTISDPSPAGDIGLIFSYMKVLDPNSTVREGEYATAANAGSAFAKVGSVYNKIINGERLTAGQRADFFKKASQYYESAQSRQKAIESDFTSKAKNAGVDPNDVIMNYGQPTVSNGWSIQEVK